jgi:ribokinase
MDVVVVGSINYDLTVTAEHHPRPGETVLGTGHDTGPGGKGANQAVAAARFGAAVAMVGRVGDDGARLIGDLVSEGIDVGDVGTEAGMRSGLAVITLDGAGENTIVVSPGANASLSAEDVLASAHLREAKVVLCQLEVPVEAISAAATGSTGLFCLNAAPAQDLPADLLEVVDLLIVNRAEVAAITGVMAEDLDRVASTAGLIRGPARVVVTLGADGVMMVDEEGARHVPTPEVDVVDTTGAGDALCGVLAASLAQGMGVDHAIRLAVAAGALATTRMGAMTAMPRRTEIEALAARD